MQKFLQVFAPFRKFSAIYAYWFRRIHMKDQEVTDNADPESYHRLKHKIPFIIDANEYGRYRTPGKGFAQSLERRAAVVVWGSKT